MPGQPVTRLSLLLVVALALAGCTLPFGGGQATPTPTPTLITPLAQPTTPVPVDTLTPTPTPEVETPTPTPAPVVTEQPGSHQVVGGQWIYSIARLYGIDPRAIIAANPNVQGNPNLIFPNQQLTIPRTAVPGAAPAASPTPMPTLVPNPTAGAASLPLTGRAVYEGLLAEALPALDGSACSTPVSAGLSAAWGQAHIGPRLGCASEAASAVTGSWIEFGPGSRITWLRERGEFHAITGNGFGQRWVFPDNSGVAQDAPMLVRPDGAALSYTPAMGRYAWLLSTYPEIKAVFSPAFGDENVISGEYQRFENGALLFDGALILAFFDDSGPWWTLAD